MKSLLIFILKRLSWYAWDWLVNRFKSLELLFFTKDILCFYIQGGALVVTSAKTVDGRTITCTTLLFTCKLSIMEHWQMPHLEKKKWNKVGWLKKWGGESRKKQKKEEKEKRCYEWKGTKSRKCKCQKIAN